METYTVTVDDYKTISWYQNGKCHRLDGPAIEYADGTKYWFQNAKLHRVDGPAIEWASGAKSWCQNAKLHRVDGPAVECADGVKNWYLNGKQLTEKEFNRQTKVPTCAGKVVEIDGKKYTLVEAA